MIIFLDRQHAGKPHRPTDLGAGADIDGDGKREIWEQEAIWTAKYLLAAELWLREKGYTVFPISDGRYSERHQRVNNYARTQLSIYVAAHINAGGGDYGAVFFDHRSTKGHILAAEIALQLREDLPELGNKARTVEASPSNWTKNAYHTISGVSSWAICFEPCFIDCAEHRPLFSDEGMKRIGEALAKGIHNFLEEI